MVLELNLVFAGSNANRSKNKIASENFNRATIQCSAPSGGPSIGDDQPAIFRTEDSEYQVVGGIADNMCGNFLGRSQLRNGLQLRWIQTCCRAKVTDLEHLIPGMDKQNRGTEAFTSTHQSGIGRTRRNGYDCLFCEPDSFIADGHSEEHRVLCETIMEAIFHRGVVEERGDPQRHTAVAMLTAQQKRGCQIPVQPIDHQTRIVFCIYLLEKGPRPASVGHEIVGKAERDRCVHDRQDNEEDRKPFSSSWQKVCE